MAEALIGGAALELALTVVYESGKYDYNVYKCSDLEILHKTLNDLVPNIDEIREVGLESTSDAWVPKIQKIKNRLQQEQNRKRSPNRFKQANLKEVEEIAKFAQNELVPTREMNQIKLLKFSHYMKDSFSTQLKTLCGLIKNLTLEQEIGFNNVSSKLDELHADFSGQICENPQQDRELCYAPDLPSLVGFEKHVMELKNFVLEVEVDMVGVTAIGGAGKSALATALCHHPEIQEYFKKRIIFIVVSESPDLLSILKTMWKTIVGGPEPQFINVEEARNQLQCQIKSRRTEPILMVLDDIWQSSDLEELLFRGEQYRTIVTARDEEVIQSIPPWFNKRHYPLLPLQKEHALSLFCRCAFDVSTIPDTHNEELVVQVQAECRGLPLALQVIGSVLNGEPDSVWKATMNALARGSALNGESDSVWKTTLNALARGKYKDDNQIRVLKCLKTSIDVLNLGEKQCFFDLAIFPKGLIIPANVLLDIWVYVRRMRRNDAILRLRKFEAWHLLNLERHPWTLESTDDCMNSYSFSQHDVMRLLALCLAEQDNKKRFRRLYMPQKQYEFPPEWQTGTDQAPRAQIVSIHTGTMKDRQWPQMEFPEAEAVLLYFTASEYCIPKFLDTMRKLKVLIIHNNDNAKRAKLRGIPGFQVLSHLKALHLERLIVPSLHEDCKGLKIYLRSCEGLGKDKMSNLPAQLEFNVDQCSDLEELSAGIASNLQDESHAPDPARCLVGFDEHSVKMKMLVPADEVNAVGIRGIGGAGKSTLAKAVCNDDEMRGLLIVGPAKGEKKEEENKAEAPKHAREIVPKLAPKDKKREKKALKLIAGIPGVDSVSVYRKWNKMAIIGDVDPVYLTPKIRKSSLGELFRVKRKAKAKEKEKEKQPHSDAKKENKAEAPKAEFGFGPQIYLSEYKEKEKEKQPQSDAKKENKA